MERVHFLWLLYTNQEVSFFYLFSKPFTLIVNGRFVDKFPGRSPTLGTGELWSTFNDLLQLQVFIKLRMTGVAVISIDHRNNLVVRFRTIRNSITAMIVKAVHCFLATETNKPINRAIDR